MDDPIMRLKLLQKDLVCVYGDAGNDSKVLQPHGTIMRLEVVNCVHQLGVDILASTGVRRLRVYHI